MFAYDFPHRKTHDFIVDLVAGGVDNLVVMGAGMKQLKHRDSRSYFATSLEPCPAIATATLCERLNLQYFKVEHDDVSQIRQIVRSHHIALAIISGARILKPGVISLFERRIINFHPGKLPETSGLDAFFYTLKKNAPAGVTTHFIDSRVDAGSEIHFDEACVTPSATPETILENIYQLQRVALRRVIRMLGEETISSLPVDRPAKNSPMTAEQKLDAISRFPAWRADRFHEQALGRLIEACALGEVATVGQIIDRHPGLLHARNSKGWTPIIVASFHGSFEVVCYLLERGANPNDCGTKGTTVLMYAKTRLLHAGSSSHALLEKLIDAGASVLNRDNAGKSVLDYVAQSGDLSLFKFLESRAGESNNGND